MTFLYCLVLAALLAVTPAYAPFHEGPRMAYVSNDPRVVELEVADGLCTAFVVAKDRLATAAHCFGHPKTTESWGTARFEGGREVPARLLKAGSSNGGTDVAIVQADTGAIEPFQLASKADAEKMKAHCFFVGFGGRYGKNMMPCKAMGLQIEESGEVLIISGRVIPGDSGGPVVGHGGKVIGLTFAYGFNGEEGFAVPSWTVQKYLNDSAKPKPVAY